MWRNSWRPTILLAVVPMLLALSLASSQAGAEPVPPIKVTDSLPAGSIDFDPATAAFVSLWTIQSATCVKLWNYPDTTSEASSELVPEAAQTTSLSGDGRTYSFTVRSGFGFSPPSTEEVNADSFRVALERFAKLGTLFKTYFSGIVGFDAFAAGSASSITGVTASGDQLSIALTAPDNAFLHKLAMPMLCAVPASTPAAHQNAPLPMAGPYYVDPASFTARVTRRSRCSGTRTTPAAGRGRSRASSTSSAFLQRQASLVPRPTRPRQISSSASRGPSATGSTRATGRAAPPTPVVTSSTLPSLGTGLARWS